MELQKNLKIEFCLPVYNEEQILEKNTLELFNYLNSQNFNFDWKIIIIINGSSDNSAKICQKLNSEISSKINFINIKQKGRGQALAKYYFQAPADILIYMDIDLATSLFHINEMAKEIIINDFDITTGSRLMPESKIKRSFIRELSSQSYNFLSRLILSHHFSDLQCGFKGIKKEAFLKIAPFIQDANWFFDTELIIFGKKLGLKIKEIPVDWREERYDKRKSKVKILKDGLIFFKNLIKLRKRLKKIN